VKVSIESYYRNSKVIFGSSNQEKKQFRKMLGCKRLSTQKMPENNSGDDGEVNKYDLRS